MRTRLVHELSALFFFFNDTATTEIYTLSLHDALPISDVHRRAPRPQLGALPASLACRARGAPRRARGARRERGRGCAGRGDTPRLRADLYALPQPRQRARSQSAVLLHLPRVPLAVQLPRRRGAVTRVGAAGRRHGTDRKSVV